MWHTRACRTGSRLRRMRLNHGQEAGRRSHLRGPRSSEGAGSMPEARASQPTHSLAASGYDPSVPLPANGSTSCRDAPQPTPFGPALPCRSAGARSTDQGRLSPSPQGARGRIERANFMLGARHDHSRNCPCRFRLAGTGSRRRRMARGCCGPEPMGRDQRSIRQAPALAWST
jgi:hypothetical protein